MIPSEIYNQLNEYKIPHKEVDRQYNLLLTGTEYCKLERPALLNDGIRSLSHSEAQKLANTYDSRKNTLSIEKFVPASGAATRMFKELAEFVETGIETSSTQLFFESINKLAFEKLVPSDLNKKEQASYILKDLRYQSTPKGLIPFHAYRGFTRTPFKEHWVEGLIYAASNGKVKLHFTVSKEHQLAFEKIYRTRIKSFLEEYKLGLEISFSQQYKSTDTFIVGGDKKILLDKENTPVMRPGGHGALIQNLNALSSELVFIKNIDNVVHQNHLEATVLYKKALAAILIDLKSNIFKQLANIEHNKVELLELERLGKEAMIPIPENYSPWPVSSKVEFWKNKFNRPIRVCGMVKNEGEPGGGPFWVLKSGETSLQIVESAQIDPSDAQQQKKAKSATHFNPVDLVCYLNDYKGIKFNLMDYVDNSAAFITKKTINGNEVNVLEHPGLWNGAMADWTTVFVEVPIETFNPVKTVNDLLKPTHLP